MTVLSAQSLRLIRPQPFDPDRKLLIDPWCERTQHEGSGMSYGLSSCGYDVRIDRGVYVARGAFQLASTLERFCMPDWLVGVVHDKSSWARQGLCVQNTVIEPGWCGYLTLELTNHGGRGLFIGNGWPIAQVVFHRLDEPTELPYRGKYQDQERGPQVAR